MIQNIDVTVKKEFDVPGLRVTCDGCFKQVVIRPDTNAKGDNLWFGIFDIDITGHNYGKLSAILCPKCHSKVLRFINTLSPNKRKNNNDNDEDALKEASYIFGKEI